MATSRSRIVLGTKSTVGMLPPIIHAFGASDDHHRLTVLLADRVEQILGRDDENTRACKNPKTVWTDRMAALKRAIEAGLTEAREPYPFGIAEIDALACSGPVDWEHRSILKERSDFFRVLLRAIDRTGWIVFRLDPTDAVSQELDELDAEVEVPTDTQGFNFERASMDLVPPDCRPIAAWLYRTGRLNPESLDDIIEQVGDVGEHLILLAHDALSHRARTAGKLLSAVRQPQRLNGAIGSFDINDDEPGPASLPRSGVGELLSAGFLARAIDGSSMVRMPRRVRIMLERQARMSVPDELREVHLRLGTEQMQGRGISEEALEVSYHALQSGDIERAKQTAHFSADLRDYGMRMSLSSEYAAAAELFQHIVDNFDPKDAYAYEYLGYNLARAFGLKEKERILEAYRRAYEYSNRTNPLYHGRLVGFQGELGEDILSEFESAIREYATGKPSSVAYFAEAVFKGLVRGHREQVLLSIRRKWAPLLVRVAPRLAGWSA